MMKDAGAGERLLLSLFLGPPLFVPSGGSARIDPAEDVEEAEEEWVTPILLFLPLTPFTAVVETADDKVDIDVDPAEEVVTDVGG